MFDTDVAVLDAAGTLAAAEQAARVGECAQVRELEVAAQWADLHAVLRRPGPVLPGCERLVGCGGAGTPEVAEFCCAELGAVLGRSDAWAWRLVAAALDLRHRLPRLWARVRAGQVKVWIARQVAEATRHLDLDTVVVVDRQVAPYADRISWARIEAVVAAAWMRTDPDAAAAADRDAEQALGVWVAPSTEHGTKSVFIRAEAPDVIRFGATVDRCAHGLGLLGDTRPDDARRAAAVGILADPQTVLDLFDQAAHAASVDHAAAAAGAARKARPPRPPAVRRPPALPTPGPRSRCMSTWPSRPWSPAPGWPGSKASARSP